MNMSKVLEGYKYADSHEWVKVENGIGFVGISDFAQAQLGNVVFVDLPEVGAKLVAKKEFGAVESVKAASDLIAPVSGTVLKVNQKLIGEPELLNQDPYANWLLQVKLSNEAELAGLMDAKEYAAIAE
jgi:glycine cleavage system H protein